MTAFPTYFTGTIAIAAGSTVVTLTGGSWNSPNAKPGDRLIVAGHEVRIADVPPADNLHATIDPWPFAAVAAGTSYVIEQSSPLRFVGAQQALDVQTALGQLNSLGPVFNVPIGALAPDPSYGKDGQFAHQMVTDLWWVKTAGVWTITTVGGSGAAILLASDNSWAGIQTFTSTIEATGIGAVFAAKFAGGVEILKKLFVAGVLTIGAVPASGSSNLVINQNATSVPNNAYFQATTIHTVGKDNVDTFEVLECYGYNGIHNANPHIVFRTAYNTQAGPSAVGVTPATRDSLGASPRDYMGTIGGAGYGFDAFHIGAGATLSFCPTQLFSNTVGGSQARIGVTPNGGLNFTYAFVFDQDCSFNINQNVNNSTPPQADMGGINPALRVVGADGANAFAQLDSHGGLSGYLMRSSGGTHGVPTPTINGGQIGFIAAFGRGTTTYNSSSGVQLRMYAEQTWTDANNGSGFAILVTPNNTNALVEALRVANSCFVGIGTNNPQTLLHLNKNAIQNIAAGNTGTLLQLSGADAANAALELSAFGTGNSVFPYFQFSFASNTANVKQQVGLGTVIGVIGARAYTGSLYTNTNSQIQFITTEVQTASNQGQGVSILSTPNGTNVSVISAKFQNGVFIGTGTVDPGYGSLNISSKLAIGANLVPDSALTINANSAATIAPLSGTGIHLIGAPASLNTITLDAFGTASQNVIFARSAMGTIGAKTVSTNGNFVLQIIGNGWDGAAYVSSSAITFNTGMTWDATHHGSYVDFYSTDITASAAMTANMRLNQSGGVTIGSGLIGTDPGAGILNVQNDIKIGAISLLTGKFAAVKVQRFIANGTYTPSAGMLFCTAECVGGGGGGGGCVSSAGTIANAAGGGAGSRSIGLFTAADIGASKAVVIGAAGAAGASGNNAGGNGGDTTLGATLLIAKGGSSGAGSNGASSSIAGAGGIPGTGNVLAASGDPGQPGFFSSTFTITVISGKGGSSPFGGGGVTGTGSPQAGSPGTGNGSGGSGGWAAAGGSAAGGAGTIGLMIIIEYCNQL